jgi:hypothetical protein
VIAPICTPANRESGFSFDTFPFALLELFPNDSKGESNVPAVTKAEVPRNSLLENFSDVILLFFIRVKLLFIFKL